MNNKLKRNKKIALRRMVFIIKKCKNTDTLADSGRMAKITKGHYKIMAFCYK